jgi:hypothetical protein
MDNQTTYILIGGIGQLILILIYKLLKKPNVYLSILSLTFLIALFGYFNRNRETLEMVNGNATDWTYFPFLFMIYYWVLRIIFLKTYKNEPLMAKRYSFSWEQGEYRKLHFGDGIFTVLTLFLPFLTTLIF